MAARINVKRHISDLNLRVCSPCECSRHRGGVLSSHRKKQNKQQQKPNEPRTLFCTLFWGICYDQRAAEKPQSCHLLEFPDYICLCWHWHHKADSEILSTLKLKASVTCIPLKVRHIVQANFAKDIEITEQMGVFNTCLYVG